MAEANLAVFITGSGKQLIDEFKKIGDSAKSQSETTSSAWSKIGGVVAGSALAVAGAAVAIGAASVKAASSYDDAHVRLVTAIKDTHGNFASLGPQIDAIDAKMASLGFKNADVEDSLGTLTVATHSGQKALNDLGLVANIARGRNIDFGSATALVSKVLTGHVALLGRYGLATKDANGKTISTTQAIKELSGAYGGQATAALKTLTGQHQAFSAEMNHVEIQIGQALMPALSKFTTFMSASVLPAFQNVVGWVEKEWPKIGEAVAPALETIHGYIAGFTNTVEHLWSQFGGRITSLATETWNHIKTQFEASIEVIEGVFRLFADLLTGRWGKLWGDVLTIFEGLWKGISNEVGLAWDLVKATVSLAWDGIKNAVVEGATHVLNFMANFPSNLLKIFANAGTWLFDAGVNIIKGLISGITSLAGDVLHSIESVIPHSVFGIHIPGTPGKALGGPVMPNMPYVVGEKGPELFMPKTAGTIVPHNQAVGSGRLVGRGGTTVIYNIAISGPIMGADVERTVHDAMRNITRKEGSVTGVRTSA
jgi:hypothetical protein